MSDIIIVGNGILGLTLAYRLLTLDNNITIKIVGPACKFHGASTAAGAMLNCFAEVTNISFIDKISTIKFEILLQALNMWPNFIEELNQYLPISDHLKIVDGTYIILNSKSGKLDTENFYAIKYALEKYKEPYDFVNPNNIPGIYVDDNFRPLNALYVPREGYIDSTQLIKSLTNILANSKRVNFINNKVVSIKYKELSAHSVKLVTGEFIEADKIVLANGSYAQEIIDYIPEIRNNIPRIFAGTGYAVTLKAPNKEIKHVIRTPNRAGACGLHVIPKHNDCVYVGASNNVHFYPQTSIFAGMTNFVIDCGIKQINKDFYNSHIVTHHIGNRPATFDTFPLIGETSIKGFYLLTGTYRDGIHQSPYTTKLLAEHILQKNLTLDSLPFKPERKLIQTLSREESLLEMRKHYHAAAYEHNAYLPKIFDNDLLDTISDSITDRIHDQLGLSTYGLTPDMLFMFEYDPIIKSKIQYLKEYLQANFNYQA